MLNKTLSNNQIIIYSLICCQKQWKDSLLLSKCLFLLDKKTNLKTYEWRRHDFGPYNTGIQDDIDILLAMNLIEKKDNSLIIKNTEMVSYAFDQTQSDIINKTNNSSRKNVLNDLYSEFDIFSYEQGDRI